MSFKCATSAWSVVACAASGTGASRCARRVAGRAPFRPVGRGGRGSGGGGGGGGTRRAQPPQKAGLPGRDPLTVAAVKPRTLEPARHPPIDPSLTPQLIIPVAALASGTEVLPGAMNAPPAPPTPSRGPGTDGGTGTGTGTGDGS